MVRRKCVLCAGCWPAVSSVHALPLIEVHAQSSLQRAVPYMHGFITHKHHMGKGDGDALKKMLCCASMHAVWFYSVDWRVTLTQFAHWPGMLLRTEHKHLLCVICTPTHHRKEFHRCPTHLYNTPQLPETFTHSQITPMLWRISFTCRKKVIF